jgi:hypothetical protein
VRGSVGGIGDAQLLEYPLSISRELRHALISGLCLRRRNSMTGWAAASGAMISFSYIPYDFLRS